MCDPTSSRLIEKPAVAVIVKKSSAKKIADSPLSDIEEKRFQVLRTWRKAKAQELDIPAFVVFGDKTLLDIAKKNPQSIDELKNIYGIGEAKLEKFGWDLLAEMSQK